MKQMWRIGALLLVLTPLACGDDDGGSSSTAAPFESSSVPDDTRRASDLTPEEQTAFCDELATYFSSQVSNDSLHRTGCYLFAFAFSGGDRNACNQAAQSCISDSEIEANVDGPECDTSKLTDCDATVAELEACFTDGTSLVKSLASRASCSMSGADLAALDQVPASCQAIQDKCPGLMEDEDEF
jgi:hypothetical protein